MPANDFVVKYEECFFDTNSIFYIALEYCDGGTLAQQIKQKQITNSKFPYDNIYKWMKEIVSGLDFLHTNKIVHQDVKPTNIFFKNDHIKLGDIGYSKMNKISFDHTIIDTTPYMSPEMLQFDSIKQITPKTDIWYVCVCVCFD